MSSKPVDARLLRAEKRGAHVLVEFPSHIVWVALDKGAAARLARERTVLSTLAGRLPVTIPIPVAHCGRACLRTKVVGRSGVEEHMRAMTDPVTSVAYAMELARLFAAVHCALSAPERARLIETGVPATTSLDLDDVVRAAYALDRARAKRAVALIRAHLAQVVLPEDCTFLHGDLHSHNVVVDDEGRITGLFDFDESCVGDRHHEFRFMPTFGRMFFERVLQVYGELTGVTVDVRRVLRI